jgi:hypothetical protein
MVGWMDGWMDLSPSRLEKGLIGPSEKTIQNGSAVLFKTCKHNAICF